MSAAIKPTTVSVLDALTRERLFDLGRVFGADLRSSRQTKGVVVQTLSETLGDDRLLDIPRELGRDELRGVCRAHSLDGAKAPRPALIERLAAARVLKTLWDLELGARLIEPEAHGLGQPARLDPTFTRHLERQGMGLIEAGLVLRWRA